MSRELDAVIIYEAGFLIIMITLICLTCGKEFLVLPYREKTAKFCSYQCHWQNKIGKKQSRETIEKRRIKLKGRIAWNKGIKMNSGENNPAWKGGKIINQDGYIYIWKPSHPFANNGGYVFEHRLVAEKCLGRYLTREERIHHINEIKDDNHFENLYLFSSHIEHRKYHDLRNKPKLISNLI